MKKNIFYVGTLMAILLIPLFIFLKNKKDKQVEAVSNVIKRILPEYANQFKLVLIGKEEGKDVFEIESQNKKILIKGSSGVAICSGLNYYLKNFCNEVYNWRCGNDLHIQGELPHNFEKIRKVSPHKYRYIFNYCTFSYSMAFWEWKQWERMIDWMALNGINMPLAPMGQELIWQRVYKKYGLAAEDLKDFFVGPAYNAFGRMGCIDGYGGPLPQSWIDTENILQKKILFHERELGMTPVLQGFTGHVPPAFAKKNPGLKFSNLKWIDFSETWLLDWKEPLFTTIGKEFINQLTKEYGTDHLYAIDQFIEMRPSCSDTSYLRNMSKKVFSGMNEADPLSKWVLQTWPFRETDYWNQERTKAYFDGVPNDRMIALELQGELWPRTGWYKNKGWYGKPWVWSIIQSFGDQVSLYGGLTQIAENFGKAFSSPEKGNLSGMGLMMEGLDYNPVIYEFTTDLMWEKSIPDLNKWKVNYLRSRYGIVNKDILEGWGHLFDFYYTKSGIFERNPINTRPQFVKTDIWPSKDAVLGAKLLIGAANSLKLKDAYQYDIVNLFRQILGQYAGHFLFEITSAYQEKNILKFDKSVAKFMTLSLKLDRLLGTRREFLFGKWISDSRNCATNIQEEKLYEWNAKAIITTWGGQELYGYAQKDWAGLYTSYYLPKWQIFFTAMRSDLTENKKLDYEIFLKELKVWEGNWNNLKEEKITSLPAGNSMDKANDLWNEYGEILLSH